MKILIITTAFPRWHDDGRAPFIYETARSLHRQGHQIRVIAMHNPGTKSHEFFDGIEVIRPKYLPEKMEVLQKEGAGLPQAWQSNKLARLTLIPFFIVHTIATSYWSRGFDIIHANWTLSGFSACLTKWKHKIPVVVTVHGSDVFRANDNWLLRTMNSFVFKRSSKIIAVSNALKSVVDQSGIQPNKTIVITNGVSLNDYNDADIISREPLILFVGSLIARKGIDVLIRAFAEISPSISAYKLIIIGEGMLRQQLEALCISLGIQNNTVFLGQQPPSSVRSWMKRAKVFVLPSNEEGQGVVLLEALASGTPCVGSRIGGIPDIITPDVGHTFSPGNYHELSEAIIDIALSKRWFDLSKNARSRVEREYNIDIVTNKISNEYKALLSESH